MTDDYEKRRQKRLEERRRQVQRYRTILGCVIALVLILIIAIASRGGDSKKAEKNTSAETKAAVSTSETTAAATDVFHNISAIASKKFEEGKTSYTPPVNPNINTYDASKVDRSNFAATPGLPCGRSDQTEEKIVYLTLDDGPSYLTSEFLDVLDNYNVKATFFVTGQYPEYASLIKEAYDRGHTIGLHTYSHNYDVVYASTDSFFADLAQVGQIVESQIGFVPCFTRFPGGSASYGNPEIVQGLHDRGFEYFDWNISCADGGPETDPGLLYAAAVNTSENNVILLMHDGANKEPSLQALPAIIEYYVHNGYEFRPITRDSFTAQQYKG